MKREPLTCGHQAGAPDGQRCSIQNSCTHASTCTWFGMHTCDTLFLESSMDSMATGSSGRTRTLASLPFSATMLPCFRLKRCHCSSSIRPSSRLQMHRKCIHPRRIHHLQMHCSTTCHAVLHWVAAAFVTCLWNPRCSAYSSKQADGAASGIRHSHTFHSFMMSCRRQGRLPISLMLCMGFAEFKTVRRCAPQRRQPGVSVV